MRRFRFRAVLALVGCAVFAASCGGHASPNTPVAPAKAPAAAPAKAGTTGVVQVDTPAPPPPPPQGVISGRIVDATSKAPLARARVILSADCETPAPPGGSCTKVLPQNRVVMTGDDGRYRLADLPIGANFVLKASRTGYAPRAFGELPPGTPPAFLALKAAEVRENADVELSPEVVLAGAVQDEDGAPFAGALVEALRATYRNGRRELVTVAEALTADRGQFRLTQMPPGQYYVSAFDPAFADVGDAAGALFYSPTFYPSATTPQLGPKRNDQFASLSNYRVDIRPDGSYLFANVAPGSYVIRARGETQGDNTSMFGIYTLSVSGADKASVDIDMSPGAIVQGFVEWQGRSKIPSDKRTIVVRAPMTDGSLSGDSVTGNLQADNTFRLKGILQGSHYIRVEGLPEPWELQRVEINGADVTDIPVDFRYGQLETGVRLIFTDASTDVFGTIALGHGDVLHGCAVIAFSTNPTTWYPRSRHVILQRPRDVFGRYVIHGLPAGEYYVAVTRDLHEGDIANPKALQQLSRSAGLRRVLLRDGERKVVDLRPVLRRTPGK